MYIYNTSRLGMISYTFKDSKYVENNRKKCQKTDYNIVHHELMNTRKQKNIYHKQMNIRKQNTSRTNEHQKTELSIMNKWTSENSIIHHGQMNIRKQNYTSWTNEHQKTELYITNKWTSENRIIRHEQKSIVYKTKWATWGPCLVHQQIQLTIN